MNTRTQVRLVSLLCTLAAATLSPVLLWGQELEGLVASVAAESPEEAFSLDRDTIDRMASAQLGELVTVTDFPTEVGTRRPARLERVDVYAPGARIWLIDENGQRELPRSERLYFRGYATDTSGASIALSMDPGTRRFAGTVISPEGAHDLLERSSGDRDLQAVRKVGGDALSYRCGSDLFDSPAELGAPFRGVEPGSAGGLTRGAGGGLREAVIAIDTDNEFHHKRFSNNTAAATAWIADMFNTMNVLYERDLDLRLTQGETIFRLDTDATPTYDDDPWTGGAGASSAQLNQFGSYWSSNHGGVSRTLAALLSGKSNPLSASGIAWLDGYCEKQSTGGGYSINQVFTEDWVSMNDNLRIVAHEIGHNLGSPHTHCYSPVVDQCYNGEGGCYSGAEACPAGGQGTLMSYCHLSGAGCGSNKLELHPTVATLMDGYVDLHYPNCIGDFGPIFEDGFETGNPNAWSSIVN